MARCQRIDIQTQYETHGVRGFDLRIKPIDGELAIVHGFAVYEYNEEDLIQDLEYLNEKGDTYVRIILDVRKPSDYTKDNILWFRGYCEAFERSFPKIHFWCGKELTYWNTVYEFSYTPTVEEHYASASTKCKLDDLWPYLYAKHNNWRYQVTDKDMLMLDFVDIY